MVDSLPSLSDSEMFKIIGKVMVGTIIVLFMVLVFVFLLQIYAKWYWSRDDDDNVISGRRRWRQQFVFPPGVDPSSALGQQQGLDPSVLLALPIVVYNSKELKDGLECAVCLCEVSEGEKARVLPKCKHGFHVDCIDMWFQSHSTCPICRNPVFCQTSSKSLGVEVASGAPSQPPDHSAHLGEVPNFPTNVLFWGDDMRVTSHPLPLEEGQGQAVSQTGTAAVSSVVTSTSNRLVIDIPDQLPEERSSSSPSAFRIGEEEMKSPITRLRNLKRFLSRGNRAAASTYCKGSSSGDVELG